VATVDLGKIKFTWRGTYADTTVYEADDVVYDGSSSFVYIGGATPAAYAALTTYNTNDVAIGSDSKVYRYINSSATAGNDPTSTSGFWAVNQPGTTSPATTFWNLMADGTNPLTTQGDVMTHDGTNAVRLARGSSGSVLKVSGSDLVFGSEQGYTGHKHLLSNYGKNPANPAASVVYGDAGKYPWLANYANNWIPECGSPNPACGPVKNSDKGITNNGYRVNCWLNENHELVSGGDDDYHWLGTSSAEKHVKSVCNNISAEHGGMRDGDYFVRLWISYVGNVILLTKDGDLFTAGYNAYGQLGTGGTTDRYMLAKVSTLGPDATHGGVSCQIAGFHHSNATDQGAAIYTSCYAIDTSGRLFVWGYNGSGKLGIGNATNQSYPVLASAISNVVSVSAGMQSAHAITSSGDLFRTGHDQNNINQGSAVTSWTDTAQNNAYQVLNNDGYYTSSNAYASAHYLNTSGEMYGIGGNPYGQLGDGTTAQKSAWVRCGGSLTFSSFYAAGNSYYNMYSALGGTPGASNNDFYNWGYNPGGQLGQGNATALSTPTQPQTTSLYSHTITSTSSNSAPTKTDIAVPVNDIHHVYPLQGISGESYFCNMIEDQYGRIWKAGYGDNVDNQENQSTTTSHQNYFLVPSPFNATGTISGTHWAGKSVVTIHDIYHTGNDYGGEGCLIMVTSDGRVWAMGYNGQGQLGGGDGSFVGQWMQLTP
jgi:alpha-tubulin suppressor-like RCC1 family protein